MEIGDCFRRNYGDHLNIVVSDTSKDPVLIVSLATYREGKFHDPSCFLEIGEHPFVKRKSYIAFQHAKDATNRELDQKLSSGQIIMEEQLDSKIVERIQLAAASSEYIALEYIELLREQGFAE